jgi:hypothetical protein
MDVVYCLGTSNTTKIRKVEMDRKGTIANICVWALLGAVAVDGSVAWKHMRDMRLRRATYPFTSCYALW